MAPVLDGFAPHMREYPEDRTFLPSDEAPCDVEAALRDSGAEILVNYLPVGSEEATRFYAETCLSTGVSLVNCIPAFIASNPEWAGRFHARGIPIIGRRWRSCAQFSTNGWQSLGTWGLCRSRC